MTRAADSMPGCRRMRAVQPPIVPAVAALIDAHPGTISLGQGMVSYGPPAEAAERLAAALADPETHRYGPVPGLGSLRSALAAKLERDNGIALGEDRRVIVTAGSNMAFLQAAIRISQWRRSEKSISTR